jgi:hypothetical protein
VAELELWRVADASVVRVFAAPDVLDGLEWPDRVGAGRVAPDEVIVLGDPGAAAGVVEQLSATLQPHAPDALAVDHSSGVAVFAIVGEQAPAALARVSDIELPPGGAGFRQGRVAEVPARVFARPGRLDVVVGADVGWFVHRRLLAAGAGLGLVEAAPPASAPVSGEASVAGG